jgi:hypothetical protein
MILSSGENSHVARMDPGGLLIRLDKSPRMELQSRVEYDKAHCTHLGSGMMAICSQCIEINFNFQHSMRRTVLVPREQGTSSLHSLGFRDDGDMLTIAMYRDYFQFST